MEAKNYRDQDGSDSDTTSAWNNINDLHAKDSHFMYKEQSAVKEDGGMDAAENKADSKDSRDQEEMEIKSSDLSIIEEAIDFCESPEFQGKVRAFKVKYADKFLDLAESKSPNDEEQDLEYTAIFSAYNELIDEQLTEEFLKKNGFNGLIFYQSCQDIVDGKFTALFEEHEYQWFIDMIQGWMDYPTFVGQMCDLAKANHMMKKSAQIGNVKLRGR